MRKIKDKLKWPYRATLSALNHMLSHVVSVPKLKEWNALLLHGRKLDLDHPNRLSEKILWLAYHSDTSVWSTIADKAAVRDFVSQKGLSQILIPSYGVYDHFEDIPFDRLPNQFVLSATHGCQMSFICRDKTALDLEALEKKVRFWLRRDLSYIALELHYAAIPHRILCTEYLPSDGDLIDYKIFCMNGRAYFTEVCTDRSKGPYFDIVDREWNIIPDVITGAKNCPYPLEKPENYAEMLAVAEKLAEDLPFCRVDLYNVDGRIYFGEMTMTPATGLLFHFTDEFLLAQGNNLSLPGQVLVENDPVE